MSSADDARRATDDGVLRPDVPSQEKKTWISVEDPSMLSIGERAIHHNMAIRYSQVERLTEIVTEMAADLQHLSSRLSSVGSDKGDIHPSLTSSGADIADAQAQAQGGDDKGSIYKELLENEDILYQTLKSYILISCTESKALRGKTTFDSAWAFFDVTRSLASGPRRTVYMSEIMEWQLAAIEDDEMLDLYNILIKRYRDEKRQEAKNYLAHYMRD
ncbi:hypothetical protein G7046_g7011 [Stylonectria norvegica]|nr:hypothetical protein G7046_g7011 [Stylonectria norvegica]